MLNPSAPDKDLDRDGLTGLPGPQMARKRLQEWGLDGPSTNDGGGPHLAPVIHGLLLSIHQFATINLAFGGAAGDQALIAVASRLTQFVADEIDGQWLTARSDGANFLVFTNQPCDAKHWQAFAERLAELVAAPIAYGQQTLRLSPRMVLSRALPQDDADAVLDRLARSLTSAKGKAGRRVVWVNGAAIGIGRSDAQLDTDLLKAIDRNEIEVVFQAQYALRQGRDDAPCSPQLLSGAEALARWNHPVLGRIGAAALFAIAERTDHVVPLARHIAQLALSEARQWPGRLRLSLNITPTELGLWRLAADWGDALRHSGFSPALLTLEVTEQAEILDIELAAASLADLARQGVRIALDDFGAGFCNFQYLKTLPLHYLKLDRSMVDNIVEDPRDLAVLRGIIAMARALGLDVIAEGIETREQADIVAREGCAFFQGYLCAHPVAAPEFLKLACAAVEG